MRLLLPLGLALAAAAPAAAQDGNWHYSAFVYGWLPGIDSTVDSKFGAVEASKSTSDVLDDLDFAFMGAFEAQNDQWSFIGDLLYASMSEGKATPLGLAYSEATLKDSVTALTGYALYRVSGPSDVAVDLGLGLRGFSLSAEATLTGAAAKTQTASMDETWVDPLIAARVILPFNDLWSATALVDAGGTNSSNTWQALATVNYKMSENWSVNAGYRYMHVEKDVGDLPTPTTLDLSGPMIGVSYRF